MGRDKRKFSIEIRDDAETLWSTLLAIEEGASRAAKEFGHAIHSKVWTTHSTGEYFRDSIDEARMTSERNGFEAQVVTLDIDKVKPRDSTGAEGRFDAAWIKATKYENRSAIDVQVIHGTEVEVNGVFTMLQEAARAAIDAPPGGDVPVVAQEPRSWWRTALEHPLLVATGATVMGGLILAGILALV